MKKPVVDYTKFTIKKLSSPEYSHLKWLLFWPVFLAFFLFLEQGFHPAHWHVMHCAADDVMSFNEIFVIPYLLWFPVTFAALGYTILYDTRAFRKLMAFITAGYSIALFTYFVYPNCQILRPTVFERDNFLIFTVKLIYSTDTRTNVCPSIHVIGSLAVLSAMWNTDLCRTALKRFVLAVITLLICIATVFIKQHSVVDVFAALPVSLIAEWFSAALTRKAAKISRRTAPG